MVFIVIFIYARIFVRCGNSILCDNDCVTYRAMLTFCKPCCCTSSLNCCVNYLGMRLLFNSILSNKHLRTYRTMLSLCKSCCLTCSFNYLVYYLRVTECGDWTSFLLVTFTNSFFKSRFCTSRIVNDIPLAITMLVSIFVGIISALIGVSAATKNNCYRNCNCSDACNHTTDNKRKLRFGSLRCRRFCNRFIRNRTFGRGGRLFLYFFVVLFFGEVILFVHNNVLTQYFFYALMGIFEHIISHFT